MSQTRRWGIGAALLALVILAAGYFLLVKPQKSKVSDLHTQAATQNEQNAQLRTKIEALQAEAKNNAQEQRILEKFATQIPDTADEPSLIRSLSQTARGAGVDLGGITPGAPATLTAAPDASTQSLGATTTAGAGQLFSLPLTLTVTGAYSNLESFFSELEHLPRAFLVNSFTFTPAPPNTSTTGGATSTVAPNALSATIQTSVFYSTPSATAITSAATPPPAPATSPAAGAPAPSSTTNPAAPAVGVARQGAGETS